MSTTPSESPDAKGTTILSCGLCGALTLDLTPESLHRAVCPECPEHKYEAQWGVCLTCGHAKAAVCHVENPPSGAKCRECSTAFADEDELAEHEKQEHRR